MDGQRIWQATEKGVAADRGSAVGGARGRGGASVAWMVTFSDLILLLLTFFVLLFSMSTLRGDAWRSFLDGLSTRFDVLVVRPTTETSPNRVADTVVPLPGKDLRYLEVVVAEAMAEDPRLATMAVVPGGDRLVLSLPVGAFGGSLGERRPTASGEVLLSVLAPLLERLDNRVQVAVSVPALDGGSWPSDARSPWDAALRDGEAVAGALRRLGYSRPVDVLAHGPGSAAVAGGGAARLSPARPVSVVVLPEGGA